MQYHAGTKPGKLTPVLYVLELTNVILGHGAPILLQQWADYGFQVEL